MDFNEIGLSEEQQQAVNDWYNNQLAEQKKEWDGKANENAERIIQGAADKVESLTGVKREQGQKIADYLSAASETFVSSIKEQHQAKLAELETKLKESKADPLIKQQLEETKQKLDALQQKEAMFADFEKNDYKGKYEQAQSELSNYKMNLAFNSVKPHFPDTVNKYEADYKWNQWISEVKQKYDIQEVDGEFKAVDKDNQYKVESLQKLLEQNKELLELSKGREVKGLGSKSKPQVKVEGVPFSVPGNATPQERTAAIRNYIVSEMGIAQTSPDYAKKFAEFNTKLLKKN